MNDELKQIKKIYGEEMMHMCRDLFPSILEHEGILLKVLTDHLAPTHSFASDVKKYGLEDYLKNWIYSYVDEKREDLISTGKTPFELMKEAGYTLYECHSEEEIQSFKHYYKPSEELCTFLGDRLKRCYVFFAVKDGAEKLNRSDFTDPQREDRYGTSVISIQFSRGNFNTLSIKNRYNHTVNNPDATFSNNLENIIAGLTQSFRDNYNLNIVEQENEASDFLVKDLNYEQSNDGKFYRYNIESDEVYFCENNIIVYHGNVNDVYAKEKERYILADEYVIDLKEKTVSKYRLPIVRSNRTIPQNFIDAFVDSIMKIGKIKAIDVIKDSKNKTVFIKYEDDKEVMIGLNSNNSIISYENDYVDVIGDDFLSYNEELNSISLPNVIRIGDYFLYRNRALKSIDLPNIVMIGSQFLAFNRSNLNRLNMPLLREVGSNFLCENIKITSLDLPNVRCIKDFFLRSSSITHVEMPELLSVGDCFFEYNLDIESLSLPKLENIGRHFLSYNLGINKIDLPNVTKVGSSFLFNNSELSSISLPNLREASECFMHNSKVREVNFPRLRRVGRFFLSDNCDIERISLPSATDINAHFLYRSTSIKEISVPCLKTLGNIQSDLVDGLINKSKRRKS